MESKGPLVAIVEDDPGVQQALRRLLHASGYRERAFACAEDFVAAGAHGEADCLVLDVRLPGASGIELYAALGRGRAPAVFITAHDNPRLRQDARALGVAVVTKPFLAGELLGAIAVALQRAKEAR
jgi:FixJ family two-component response regulator